MSEDSSSVSFVSDTGYLPTGFNLSKSVFSSADIVAYATLPGRKSVTLGTLGFFDISTHRDKFPVTSCGKVGVKGFTYGHRVVAGTMVFSSVDRSVWQDLILSAGFTNGKAAPSNPYTPRNNALDNILPDMLPAFDVSISFVNNSGHISYTGVLGVTILDEGETYSVNNISLMETYSYMAIRRLPFQSFDFSTGTGSAVTPPSMDAPMPDPSGFISSLPLFK